MSTTEDYLDQLLRSASGVGNDDTGELDSELQSEESIIPLESSIEEDKSAFEEEQSLEQTMEMPVEDGLSLEQAMEMSVDDILSGIKNLDNNIEVESKEEIAEDNSTGMMSEEAIAAMFAASESAEAEPAIEESEESSEPVIEEVAEEEIPEDNNTGMMSEEAIAAMFAASESAKAEPAIEESEEPSEPVIEEAVEEEIAEDSSTGMMSEEAIAAMFAASESVEAEPAIEESEEPSEPVIEEAVEEEIPEDSSTGMMSEEAIAAMFAASESAEAEPAIEESEEPSEISLDDMLAGMREETSEAIPEDFSILSEDEGQPDMEAESEAADEGNDSILDLLNMMSEDEDLKDIGDLLKSDEDSYFDISDDELFGEPPVEDEEVQQEPEEKEKTQGFFGKLFGKKNAGADKTESDENEQIIKEVEEEIKQEEVKAEKKGKKKKAKKKKNVKVKDGEEGQESEEGKEAQDGKKEKKQKKKKEKKVKPPKEKEMVPKEPPLPKKPVILIMLMAASILALVLLSHNVIDYQFSISKADSSFINRNYEEAYENILGVNVKEDDKQLYNRIRVMMKLEAKYKMYLLHIEQNKYDEALNDLIMGVVKYDQYKKDAEELGINQAFDDELALIEEQLNVVFGVDADQARDWYNTLSALDYTEMVRNVVKAAGYTVEETEIEENAEGTSNDLSQFGVEEVE